MKILESASQSIGSTPLIALDTINQDLKGRILGKAEFFNPAGSIKDRLGSALINHGEASGLIDKDTLIVEPTSGNTGIALAFLCAAKGYRLCLTMPETMSEERKKLLTFFGAELVLTPGDQGIAGAVKKARQIAEETENAYMPDQFSNPANPDIHRKMTAPEILLATGGKVDAFVAGVGTGGTITGVGQVLKLVNPEVRIIAVEPENSPVLSGGASGKHKIQGIGAGFIPKVLDTTLIDEIITVADTDAIETAKLLAAKEGLLCGISSGASVWAAMTIARQENMSGKNIVTILPDTGERYISTDLFK